MRDEGGGRVRGSLVRLGVVAMLGVAVLFFCLHFAHLRADFPNNSPWVDWAKYTDEGWYGDAAIRHFERGRWYVPGDFNPAVALPVWPVLEGVVFRVAGVGIVQARALTVAVFGLTLVGVYLLLRRRAGHDPAGDLVPCAAVLLLAVNPFCYAFTRMAILEPLLNLWTVTALLVASEIRAENFRRGRRLWPYVALGFVLPLMVLTKTTAIFLFPAVMWMMLARGDYRFGTFVRRGAISAGIGGALWLMYFGLLVRSHYLADYRYLFSANAYTAITLGNAGEVLRDVIKNGMWIGPVIFPLSLLMMAIALFGLGRLRSDPLVVSLALWAGGYAAFLAYHNNLQPRYYLVLAVPLTLLIPMVLERIWERTRGVAGRGSVVAMVGVLGTVVATDARVVLGYVRQPQYTYFRAAEQIRSIIRSDPNHSDLVLSISGSDLSLMTGLPSICDDFGTMDLEERVATYHPGWYVAWNQVEDDKMEALSPTYQVERVAAFPAMDDPDRNLLILYRLDPAMSPGRRRRRARRPTPKLLVTKMGQQPSVTQLQH